MKKIELGTTFRRDLKQLAKKYRSVLDQVELLARQLQAAEVSGDQIPDVGYDAYKVRLANPSAGKGKSGGFRVIYYVRVEDHLIFITIYSKSEKQDIAPEAIRQLIEEYLAEASEDSNPNKEDN